MVLNGSQSVARGARQKPSVPGAFLLVFTNTEFT